jgi:hypothetical protein
VSSIEENYIKSIAHVLLLLKDLIGCSIWIGHPMETHLPASESEMASVLVILKTLSPLNCTCDFDI